MECISFCFLSLLYHIVYTFIYISHIFTKILFSYCHLYLEVSAHTIVDLVVGKLRSRSDVLFNLACRTFWHKQNSVFKFSYFRNLFCLKILYFRCEITGLAEILFQTNSGILHEGIHWHKNNLRVCKSKLEVVIFFFTFHLQCLSQILAYLVKLVKKICKTLLIVLNDNENVDAVWSFKEQCIFKRLIILCKNHMCQNYLHPCISYIVKYPLPIM